MSFGIRWGEPTSVYADHATYRYFIAYVDEPGAHKDGQAYCVKIVQLGNPVAVQHIAPHWHAYVLDLDPAQMREAIRHVMLSDVPSIDARTVASDIVADITYRPDTEPEGPSTMLPPGHPRSSL